MAWDESHDEKIQKCIDRLGVEERRLNEQVAKIVNLKSGASRIHSKKETQTIDDKKVIVSVPPKDLSGDPMDDDYRLEQLSKIITKTDDLLGPEEVQDE